MITVFDPVLDHIKKQWANAFFHTFKNLRNNILSQVIIKTMYTIKIETTDSRWAMECVISSILGKMNKTLTPPGRKVYSRLASWSNHFQKHMHFPHSDRWSSIEWWSVCFGKLNVVFSSSLALFCVRRHVFDDSRFGIDSRFLDLSELFFR
jgi:hypothetical protein